MFLCIYIAVSNKFFFNEYPLENHAWRNTQTLIAVENIERYEDGIYKINVFGNVSTPLEYPVYQYVIFTIKKVIEFTYGNCNKICISDLAKVINIFFYVMMFMLPAIFAHKDWFKKTILFSSLCIVIFNYEYMPLVVLSIVPDILAASIFTLYLILLTKKKEKNILVYFSLALTALIKITTPLVFIGLFFLSELKEIYKRKNINFNHIFTAVSIIVPILIYKYFDFQKNGNIISSEFTSSALMGWNFGSPAIFYRFGAVYYGSLNWIHNFLFFSMLIFVWAYFSSKNSVLYIIYGSFILMPIVFVNLYTHNYYQASLLPLLIAGTNLINLRSNGGIKVFAVIASSIFILGFPYSDKIMSHSQKSVSETIKIERQNNNHFLEISNYINKRLDEDDLYIATGIAYSPVISYLSDRRGLAFTGSIFRNKGLAEIIDASGSDNYKIYIDCGDETSKSKIKIIYLIKKIYLSNSLDYKCDFYELTKK
jgi:hypothetical protein